ncbi:hypothetical protein ACPOL_0941 [Acidisarcina polymorpha]|uniref:Uncharacterized protein n=1 Tax=Acidisarcina polymorpha TaxID=2211140 RepID=A0A2Z5FUX4_9BACT|nr:hypothetical protein [Acidisarcina polymorpha]AXC10294.1 hypothetical protein ACPOL_0941 [Acidisarcina polymorpha]
MSDISRAREMFTRRILDGEGKTTGSERQAAFNNTDGAGPGHSLIDEVAKKANRIMDEVAKKANRIMDEDIAAAKASGLSEDQIFELVICAAVGQATRQYEAGIAALRQTVGEV